MKKTMIALVALSGMATASDLTYTDAAANIMQTSSCTESACTYAATAWGQDGFTLSNITVTPTITKDVTAKVTNGTAYTNSFALVNTNIGNDGVFDYTITFTVNFAKDVTALTLSDVSLDFFSVTAGGAPQSAAKNVKAASYALSSNGTELSAGTGLTASIAGSNANKAVYTYDAEKGYSLATGETPGVMNISLGNVVMTNGATYTLKLTGITKADGAGTLVGIGNVKFTGKAASVPEPATATLSLLALAGLAARRRRH